MTTKQEFNCVFCKDIFENKEDLQEHFRKHGDPKYKNRFEIDTQASDEKAKEKVELVSCDVCAQVFPTISKAITHKHKMHPDHDAKYFCPWCGKLFTMKHLFNVHVKTNHGKQENIEGKRFRCDSCCVDFYIPSAMINHNKFFHRQDTDLPDVGQSKKVKFYDQEVIPIYYCAFCGEEYENKVNLFKHTTDDHGDENQSPDEVLKCPMCEAVFYHLDAYEIHLTFHSSEDMYSLKNPEFNDLLDYSLETVPPIIEKVENLEAEDETQDTDAESTINAVGIEKFLELAMDQPEDGPVKAKKHKKHKKSKKSAITLDEFLSMNQDVFGEDLDFQGIEEVPTRVVKKQLKNNKKTSNTAVTHAELDKLKKAGIVVKRKISRNPIVKGLKVTNAMSNRNALNKPVYKINKVREIETSSEVLTKLMNQSNNQIKIVKKINPNTVKNSPKLIKDLSSEEAETACDNMNDNPIESNHNIEEISTPIPKSDGSITKDLLPSSKLEQSPVTAATGNSLLNKLSESNINSDVVKEINKNISNDNENTQKTSETSDYVHSIKPVNYKTCERVVNAEDPEHEKVDKNECDQFDSDTELDDRENKSDSDNCVNNDTPFDENRDISDNNSNHDNVFSTSASSLSTLKHLSHLTVKPVNQNRNNLSTEPTNDKMSETNSPTPQNDNNKETSGVPLATDRASLNKTKNVIDKNPNMDALKTLSKNITIKSLSSKRNIDEREPEEDVTEEKDKTSNLKLQDVSCNKNKTIKKTKVETSEPKPNSKIINSLNNQDRKGMPGKQLITKPPMGKNPTKIIVEKADSLPTSNAIILKRLTNITTKPIMNKNNCMPSAVTQPNVANKVVETEKKKEEIIEIFDIDDSEDEDENSKQSQPTQNSKSMDALKNLSKNITIKSLNQQSNTKSTTAQKKIKIENTITNIKIEKEENNSQNKFNDEPNIDTLINMQNRSQAFKNVLHGLCKNITIKSQNTSPSQFPKSEEYNTQDSKVLQDNEASDSDSCPGNIKITELDEDMKLDGDNEDNSERTEMLNTNLDHPIVESPKESCSENEDEDVHDFETDIKVSTVQKCNQSMNSTINSVCLNNLKNKNITIKSLSKSLTDNDEKTKQEQIHDSQETAHIQKKQLPMKTSKQIVKELHSDNVNRISKNVDHASAQSWNKKLSAMKQVNTVNKEVTVKTIQTKTVIQEITTTVTKTIKTVNQTMKQEVRNSFQTNTPQRIQGIRPSQSKNLQGVVIRHESPMLGARTSNTIAQIRPASTVVRPSKQIVPMRAGINLARPNNPRMVAGKKITPSPSPKKQVTGRPLKISPTAVVSSPNVKRHNTEDVSGPFSCFKKPKESLIPVSDIPSFANSGSEGTALFTSASHTSSSNFTSTTKIVKGNSVMTAKQMKSEVNATSQQLSRLSNKTGLKIMTSQHKQSQVQEHSEPSPMKRTTLDAIQRLQQQGLLVKKPRVDVNEGSGGSDHDNDDNVGYSSADEPDE